MIGYQGYGINLAGFFDNMGLRQAKDKVKELGLIKMTAKRGLMLGEEESFSHVRPVH